MISAGNFALASVIGSRLFLAASRQRAPAILYGLSHPRRQRLLSVTQIVSHLQVHPEFRRRFEKRPQPDRRFPCDASFILNNRCYPVGRHPDCLRERVCRQGPAVSKIPR